MRSFADLYFGTRFFDRRLIYELLGIRIFKRYLPGSGDRAMRRKCRKAIKNGNTETLKEYYESTKKYEKIHLESLCVVFPVIFLICALILASYEANVYFFLFLLPLFLIVNLLFNIYPIMLQRYNRARIEKILKKRAERKTGKNGGTHAYS